MRTFLGVILLLVFAPDALRASFVFQNAADTSDGSPFEQITTPSVGADGTVVFQATLKSGVSGIYAYKNGQLTTIADTTQGYTSFGTIPTANSRGDIAFSANTGVYKFSNGLVTKLPLPGASAPSPSISDDGRVAVTYGAAVEATSGSTVQNYSSGYLVNEAPVINSSGVAAFASVSPSGIYTSDGTHITRVFSTTTQYATMNNSSVVAIAVPGSGFTVPSQILTGNGTTTTTVASVSGLSPHDGFTAFYTSSAPGINDDGLVCFHPYSGTTPDPETEALVFGSQWTHVIGTGDSLFGSTIATGQGTELFNGFGLQTARASFEGDYLAFRYYLANGVEGIALTQIPEPMSTVAFLMLLPVVRRRY